MVKKLLSLLLITAMLLTLLVSCKDNNGDEPPTGAPGETQGTNKPTNKPSDGDDDDEEEIYDITEILPDYLNYNNTEFVVSVRNAERTIKDLGIENDGSALSEELFERTACTEERLGVAIAIDYLASTNVNDTIDKLRTNIQTNQNTWDAVAGVSYRIPQLASEGLFYNLYNFDYLDMSQEWWSQNLVKELTVNDRLFLATGDISTEYMDWCHAIFFNQTLAKAMGMDYSSFYELVASGKWTFDQLNTLSKNAYSNLNGNDAVDEGDQFGLLISSTMLQAFYGAARINVVVNNGTDRPYFEFNADLIDAVWSKIQLLIDNEATVVKSNSVTVASSSTISGDTAAYFASGKSLFLFSVLNSLVDFTDMKDDFGVLPSPKYDESQKEYGTQLHSCALWCIPMDAKDPEMSAAVMTSMAYDSHEIVIEPHFERLLKTRYVKDSESGYMIDTIYYNMFMNFDSIYNEVFYPGSGFSDKNVMPMFIFGAFANGNSGSASSWWIQNRDNLQTELEFVISSFYK